MIKNWDIIYERCSEHPDCTDHGYYSVLPPHPVTTTQKLNATYTFDVRTFLGIMLLALGFGGIFGPLIPSLRLETAYALQQASIAYNPQPTTYPLPKSVPVVFEPLKGPDGAIIEPVSTDFGIVIPKIGVNATVIPGVDPTKQSGYVDALQAGVAHANTSFFPSEDGTVYLFSHSTNYDWFVKDLNAVFYLVKNLEKDDVIVLMYKNKRYTYKITSKKVVSPKNISYLIPYAGKKNLILQTCWPPGSTTERLLIFADLIEEQNKQI